MNTTQTPLITVVIPVYNVEAYVEKCVTSVCNQHYTNLDIILVDDGSTDSSGKICDELAKKDTRIRVLHTENHGLSAARNAGIDIAKGSLIGFVDSDDWIEPDMYSFLYNLMKEHDADVTVCTHYIDKNGKSKCKRQMDHPVICNRDETMELLMIDKLLHNYAWDKLYKIELFEGLRYPEGILYEDIAFTFKVLYRAKKNVIFAQPKYHYLVRPGSIVSQRYTVKRNLSYFNSEYILMTFMVEHGYSNGAKHLVRRGIHTLKKLILSNAPDEILLDILERLRPYHYIGIKEIGCANVWRRYMMENHLQLYKKLYRFSKKIFK